LIEIVNTANQLAHGGDFSRRLPMDTTDPEVRRLIATFNRLIRRVDQLLETQNQLLADTSHELRTPLTTLGGNLNLLKNDLPSELRAEVIADSEAEVARMTRLIRDLLDLAATAEVPGSEVRPVRLDVLLEETSRRLGTPTQFALELEPVTVGGDEDRLRRLITNLVENALRYSSTSPGAIRLVVHREPPNAVLRVEDDGPGVPVDSLERVFDRFFRVDSARSPESGGTGLGLAIVRHIAESHGGKVVAGNRPEGGAVFTVTLPAEPSWVPASS
jgi:signal transduction histidine kinase